ncbi:hypothetical protein [Klenkia brasiliensis]|uniref:hypothetical protein n=1 Tax=Klenkia brasiliensis TaxID=333142 RepID=UPI000B821CE9|nr:hypothetical protein [Klenkia brasiliensis]
MTQGSFFPPVPAADRDLDDVDAAAEVGPTWYRPSELELPGAVAWVVVIGSSPTTVVSLENWRVSSNGVTLTLAIRAVERGRRERKALWQALGVHHGRGELAMLLPPGGLRFGFGFADGRTVTSLDESGWTTMPEDVGPAEHLPDRPCLEGLGRSTTGAATWQRDVWLWPLPPPGTLTAVCSWPDRDIPETTTELDADEVLMASRRARAAFGDA